MAENSEIIRNLADEFAHWPLDSLTPFLPLMSTVQPSGQPLPPYVPHVGPEFDQHRVMIYATAQNLRQGDSLIHQYNESEDKGIRRLYRGHGDHDVTPSSCCRFQDVEIQPYSDGLLPALAGVLVYARSGVPMTDLNEIHRFVAVTNYYKFSLHMHRDLNPDSARIEGIEWRPYWEVNDDLVDCEIEALNPKMVLIIGNRRLGELRFPSRELFKVNDPSWIKRGAGGVLTPPNGSWCGRVRSVMDAQILKLIEGYIDQMNPVYGGKRDCVRVYLKKYFMSFSRVSS